MKKVAPTDTVFLEGSRKLCVGVCIYAHFLSVFCKEKCEKSPKTLVENLLESLDTKSWPSEVAMGWDGMGKIWGFRD